VTEPQRARAIEAVQLRLFELEQKRLRLVSRLEVLKGTGTKRCRQVCGEVKPVSEFYEDPRYADGYYPYCRDCKSEMGKQWYRKHKAA